MREGDARQAAQDGPEDQSRQRDKLMGQRGRHACLNVLQLRRSNQMGQDDEDQTCNRGRRRTRKKLRPRPPVGPRSKLMRESPNEQVMERLRAAALRPRTQSAGGVTASAIYMRQSELPCSRKSAVPGGIFGSLASSNGAQPID